MPNTTAVRKAKDIRAASTLSLVRSSIALPPASVDASCPAPTQESRDRFDSCQAKSLLQRNNSRLSNEVSGLPHRLMHNNHVNTSLIQETCLSKRAVLTLHSDCRACEHPNDAPIASFQFLYRKKVADGGMASYPRRRRCKVATDAPHPPAPRANRIGLDTLAPMAYPGAIRGRISRCRRP
jgi:hypothetical protein